MQAFYLSRVFCDVVSYLYTRFKGFSSATHDYNPLNNISVMDLCQRWRFIYGLSNINTVCEENGDERDSLNSEQCHLY